MLKVVLFILHFQNSTEAGFMPIRQGAVTDRLYRTDRS